MRRTTRTKWRYDRYPWFASMAPWQRTRDSSPRHCLCHAGSRKHRRLTRKVTRQMVKRLLHAGDHVTPSFLGLPAAYY